MGFAGGPNLYGEAQVLSRICSGPPPGASKHCQDFLIYSDHLGTPLALADLDGNVVQAMRYDAFGNLLVTLGDIVRLPRGFAGGLFDADTALTRFVWRDYDADTGRFTALDPLGEKGGDSDWYGYCVDDPVNRVDAWGGGRASPGASARLDSSLPFLYRPPTLTQAQKRSRNA